MNDAPNKAQCPVAVVGFRGTHGSIENFAREGGGCRILESGGQFAGGLQPWGAFLLGPNISGLQREINAPGWAVSLIRWHGVPPEKRRNYFRLDGAKNNYAPIEEAEWFERQEVQLPNGDAVAVAWPWIPPSLAADVLPSQLNQALDQISEPPAGWLYSAFRRGKDHSRWAGQVIMDVTGLNDKQASNLIAAWLKSGLLYQETYHDEAQRKDRTGVRVNDAHRPTNG